MSLKVSDSSRCHAFRNACEYNFSNGYSYAHRVSSTIPKCYDEISETFPRYLGNPRWYEVRNNKKEDRKSYRLSKDYGRTLEFIKQSDNYKLDYAMGLVDSMLKDMKELAEMHHEVSEDIINDT